MFRNASAGLLVFILVTVLPSAVLAHVKWFSEFSFADRPLALPEAITPTFIALFLLSMLAIGSLVFVDRHLASAPWYQRINAWLEAHKDRSLLAMRIATGAVMLLSWQADAMLVPELPITAEWIGWFQFIIACLLLFRLTVPLAGIALIALYLIGVFQFSPFHMLDYVAYLGAGYFLAVSNTTNPWVRGTGLPALYLTVGFSLCWVALEKIIYPQWGLYVLQQNPQLALGLDVGFFLTAAAFVEFSLGYLLIICLLQRPMALVITLVFFTTTLVFGKIEVIGHTLIHGALIVFLLEGPGDFYRAPITFHQRIGLRTAFASINFALLFAILLIPYAYGAMHLHQTYTEAGLHRHEQVEVAGEAFVPTLELAVHEDPAGGWNLQLITENFRFAPESIGGPHITGEGHAHLYINDRKAARLYGPWYQLPALQPGTYEIRVTLSSNDHREYALNGVPIAARHQLTVQTTGR